MATLNSTPVVSDWLKSESEQGPYRSRDTATLLTGQGVLQSGTVLGTITANSKKKVYDPTASDGSQSADSILIGFSADNLPCDTTGGDLPCIVLARDAVVGHAGLIWGAAVNTANLRAAGEAQLKAKGLIVRQSA